VTRCSGSSPVCGRLRTGASSRFRRRRFATEEALKEFRAAKATERRVTPSVVLPNPLIDELAATPPGDLESLGRVPYLGEKRVRLYGEELLRVLRDA